MSSAVLLYAPKRLGLPGVWLGLTLLMTLRMTAGFCRSFSKILSKCLVLVIFISVCFQAGKYLLSLITCSYTTYMHCIWKYLKIYCCTLHSGVWVSVYRSILNPILYWWVFPYSFLWQNIIEEWSMVVPTWQPQKNWGLQISLLWLWFLICSYLLNAVRFYVIKVQIFLVLKLTDSFICLLL